MRKGKRRDGGGGGERKRGGRRKEMRNKWDEDREKEEKEWDRKVGTAR